MTIKSDVDLERKKIAEAQIRKERRAIKYRTVSYALKYFCNKISELRIEKDLKWNIEKQSFFIDSLLLGFPVLEIVIQENSNTEESEIKIVDGSQRLYTAVNFIKNNLVLNGLNQLAQLNNFQFEDLAKSRQIDFEKTSVRTIVVQSSNDLSVWKTTYN